MIGVIRIPRLSQAQPFVDKDGRLTNEALRRLNEIFSSIETSVNAVIDAQNAADAAQIAADAASMAAANAQAAADSAAAAGGTNARESALANSGTNPATVLTATPTLITIAAHQRIYGDGTMANVNAGSIAATAASDTDYVFYTDVNRTGGAVTYQVSNVAQIQTGDKHVVGAIMIPTTGSSNGGKSPPYPGRVEP